MSFSYSGDPSQSPKDAVRYLVQDTNSSDPLVQDEEIAWVLSQFGDTRTAAIDILGTIIIRLSARINKQVGDLRIYSSDRFNQAEAALAALKSQSMHLSPAIPYAGGVSEGDMEIDRDNDDTVQPQFALGFTDNSDTSNIVRGQFRREVPG